MLGKWKISVNTPFGEEIFILNIFSNEQGFYGDVQNNNGTLKINSIIFLDNKSIHWKETTQVPIDATINFTGLINNNLMTGFVEIDEYLRVPFEGVLDVTV